MQRPWVSSPAYAAAVELLVETRVRLGVSQRELAERLAKPRSFVTKIEARERRVDMVEFVAIARALGISAGQLMSELADALPDDLAI
jgi:transcriptional regulator with XRE-family HTH domain